MSQRQSEDERVDRLEVEIEEVKPVAKKAAEQEEKKKAKLESEEDRQRKKQEAEEARKAKTAGKVAKKTRKANAGIEFITTDNMELLSGPVTLVMDSGAQGSQISRLIYALSRNPQISVLSSGGVAGKGSWVSLSVREPTSIYQALYQIPFVKLVANKGVEVHVTLGETE